MKLLDKIINGQFKKDKKGNTIFYPYGIFVKGYILTNSSTEKQIRKLIKLEALIDVPILLTVWFVLGWPWLIPVLLFFLLRSEFKKRKLLANCERTDKRLSLKESLDRSTKIYNKFILWMLWIMSTLIVIGSLFLIGISDSNNELATGWLCLLFFGFCSFTFAHMLKIKYIQ